MDRHRQTRVSFASCSTSSATVQLDDLVVTSQRCPPGRGHPLRDRGRADRPDRGRRAALRHRRIARAQTMPGQVTAAPGRGAGPADGARAVAGARAGRAGRAGRGRRPRTGAVPRPDGAAARRRLRPAGQPVFADFSFMNGEKGGHVSISGISGVATKTSYALFLLYMLLETAQGRALLGPAAAQHAGARVQRQGRGPAAPGPAEREFADAAARAVAGAGSRGPRAVPRGALLRAAGAGRGGDSWSPDAQPRQDAHDLRLDAGAIHPPGASAVLLHRRRRRGNQVGFVEQLVRAELAR